MIMAIAVHDLPHCDPIITHLADNHEEFGRRFYDEGPFVHALFLHMLAFVSRSRSRLQLSVLDLNFQIPLILLLLFSITPRIRILITITNLHASIQPICRHTYKYILMRFSFLCLGYVVSISIPSFHVVLIHASSLCTSAERRPPHVFECSRHFRYSYFYRFSPLRYSGSFL